MTMARPIRVTPTDAAPDVHAVPFGAVHHRADRLCPCAPRPCQDLVEPGRVVFVHRRPEERGAEMLAEREGEA